MIKTMYFHVVLQIVTYIEGFIINEKIKLHLISKIIKISLSLEFGNQHLEDMIIKKENVINKNQIEDSFYIQRYLIPVLFIAIVTLTFGVYNNLTTPHKGIMQIISIFGISGWIFILTVILLLFKCTPSIIKKSLIINKEIITFLRRKLESVPEKKQSKVKNLNTYSSTHMTTTNNKIIGIKLLGTLNEFRYLFHFLEKHKLINLNSKMNYLGKQLNRFFYTETHGFVSEHTTRNRLTQKDTIDLDRLTQIIRFNDIENIKSFEFNSTKFKGEIPILIKPDVLIKFLLLFNDKIYNIESPDLFLNFLYNTLEISNLHNNRLDIEDLIRKFKTSKL